MIAKNLLFVLRQLRILVELEQKLQDFKKQYQVLVALESDALSMDDEPDVS